MRAFNQPRSTVSLEQGEYANTGFTQWSASGLAAVWAEENTRDSIFKAFEEKKLRYNWNSYCGSFLWWF